MDQQIGPEPIKALCTFKHSVPPLKSVPILMSTASEKKASVVSPEDKQCCGRKPVFKIEHHKPSFNVARDTLTKKWVFVKKKKQLGSWPLWRFLDTYKRLSSGSNIDATRLAMIMQEIRKLTQASEKRKREKKAISRKNDPTSTTK